MWRQGRRQVREVPKWKLELEAAEEQPTSRHDDRDGGASPLPRGSHSHNRSRSRSCSPVQCERHRNLDIENAEDDDDEGVDLSMYDVGDFIAEEETITADAPVCTTGNDASATSVAKDSVSEKDPPNGQAHIHGSIDTEWDEVALCRAVLEGKLPVRRSSATALAAAHTAASAQREELQRRAQRQAARKAMEEQETRKVKQEAEAESAAASRSMAATDETRAAREAAAHAEASARESARAAYRVAWASLHAWDQLVVIGPAAPPTPLRFAQIPWPVSPEHRPTQPPLSLDTEAVRLIVLAEGVFGAEARRALQDELRRWHPDKFVARFGGALDTSERSAVLDGVNATSQCLTELLAKL
jgi:hypothetical protein